MIDYTSTVGSINTAKSWLDVMHLPAILFFRPQALQGSGTSAMIFALWLPAAVLAYVIARRWPATRSPAAAAAAILLYAYAYWLLTSDFVRYALLFIPLLCAFVASLLSPMNRLPRAVRWLAVAVLMLGAIPSPAARAWYATYTTNQVTYTRTTYNGDRAAWLEAHSPGYREVEYIARVIHGAHREDVRVYRLNLENATLYFKAAHIAAVGEWGTPARYRDFVYSIDHDRLGAFLERLGVGIVVIPPKAVGNVLSMDETDQLDEEMGALGYRRVLMPGDGFVLYFSPVLGQLPPP